MKLICEAGTGFNNIDLAAAAAKGIAVANVPAYSSDAVAQVRKAPSWPRSWLGQLQPFIAVFPQECMSQLR